MPDDKIAPVASGYGWTVFPGGPDVWPGMYATVEAANLSRETLTREQATALSLSKPFDVLTEDDIRGVKA